MTEYGLGIIAAWCLGRYFIDLEDEFVIRVDLAVTSVHRSYMLYIVNADKPVFVQHLSKNNLFALSQVGI